MENRETFQYTYSAKEQEEIRAIRKKYVRPEGEEGGMVQLRRLDAAVTRKSRAVALVFGVIGALIMGFGMSLVMTELGAAIGMGQSLSVCLGVAMGTVGMGLVGGAYPIYNRMVRKEREKIAPEIIRLADELMK